MITRDDVQVKLDALTKPVGSLGRLEALAVELALAGQSLTPSPARAAWCCSLPIMAWSHKASHPGPRQ